MTYNLTCTFKWNQALKDKVSRLADAEGERMVSEGEMIRRLIERAPDPAEAKESPRPAKQRALGLDKIAK
jgi:hypothetical protein